MSCAAAVAVGAAVNNVLDVGPTAVLKHNAELTKQPMGGPGRPGAQPVTRLPTNHA
jgi:hypothetical protein